MRHTLGRRYWHSFSASTAPGRACSGRVSDAATSSPAYLRKCIAIMFQIRDSNAIVDVAAESWSKNTPTI